MEEGRHPHVRLGRVADTTPAAISQPSVARPPSPAGSADGRLECEVLVIGGGSTGVGVASDAALRGFSTVLVERGDLATGTTGRFHGLLHSGGRYAVKDPQAARECIAENVVLRRIAADCIEDTGGLFVTTPMDDPQYGDRFIAGCRDTGVPAEEIPVAEALRREPRLNPRITRAFVVPDATVDAWKTVWTCASSATEHGARILTYHEVVAVTRTVTRYRHRRARSGRRAGADPGAGHGERGRRLGRPDRGHGRLPGPGAPRQGDHDGHQPPAGADRREPVRAAGRRRHPGAHPDGLRHRHHRHAGGRPRSLGDHPSRDRSDAGRGREAGARISAARMLRVWGGVRPLFQDHAPARPATSPARTPCSITAPATGWTGSSPSPGASSAPSA